jgi:2-methylisocitrate lyase-like PEP mutase family enzyme
MNVPLVHAPLSKETHVHTDGGPSLRTAVEQAERLRQLHRGDNILVLVNVWDVASARLVAARDDVSAIATASAAYAASHGFPDHEVMPFEEVLLGLERICRSVDLPVTADLEAGYGDPRDVVSRAVSVGVVGANIEDRMDPVDVSLQRMRAAIAGAGDQGVPLVLNARTDAYLKDPSGSTALEQSRRRGSLYLGAGADCVFVPGCVAEEDISVLVGEFGAGHLSLLGLPGCPPPDVLEELGVARVSYGPRPFRAALEALGRFADDVLRPSSSADG